MLAERRKRLCVNLVVRGKSVSGFEESRISRREMLHKVGRYLAYNAPHGPLQAPEEWIRRCNGDVLG